MSSDTIFGKIIRGEIPAHRVYEDDDVLAFRDVNPTAPTHVLVIPKVHPIPSMDKAEPAHAELLGKLLLAAAHVARAEGVAEDGYRIVINTNPAAGQTVYHLHVHLIGGRNLAWPPG